ncbi:MAG: low molecular weight protein arginine phosphatase [Peptococcaceae bacterium]|nr:low molecular weight protein arginine phosphatase [Peptococcaceae bacterium]
MELLFLCDGNTCRSAMAAPLARRLCDAEGLSAVAVDSAGLAASPGDGAKREAVRVCALHGIDLSDHRAKALTTDMVARADHIYTMTFLQAVQLRQRVPAQAAKIELLSGEGDIENPLDGDADSYERCYVALENALRVHLDAWKNEE